MSYTLAHFFQIRIARKHCYSRSDHKFKIDSRKQRTDIGKYSFLNRTISDWNQLPAAAFEGSPLTVRRFKINLDRLL